ncbi:MAG: hypothetical protein ACOC57_00665 [Acidobacteriota bacterium]
MDTEFIFDLFLEMIHQ